jgi:hypothetical protein
MPRRVLVCYAAFVYHSIALDASLSVILLVAIHADDLLIARDETLVSNRLLTDLTAEALLVPLLAFVLKLLHSCPEQTLTSVASRSEVVVMAISAIELVVFTGERTIDQRSLTIKTLEALLMPMPLLVRQILRIGADWSPAVFAGVGKQRFVALDTERFLVSEDVTISCQVEVTVETGEKRRILCCCRLLHL